MASQQVTTTRLERFIRSGLAPGFVLLTAVLVVVWFIVAAEFIGFVLYAAFGCGVFGWAKGIAAEDVLKAAWYSTPLTVAYVAALIGYHKFGIFREEKPHFSIELSASSRSISAEHNHIGVTARIHNTSKVAVPVVNVEWEVAVVTPYSVMEIREMEQEFLNLACHGVLSGEDDFPWRRLAEPVAVEYDMIVEPNEVEQITFDFILQNSIEVVVILLYVENVIEENKTSKWGWNRRLYYDVVHSRVESPEGEANVQDIQS